MQCNKIKKHISRYLDNELAFQLKKEFEEHIKNCSNCQEALQQEEMIWAKLDSFESLKPNPWAFTRIQAVLDQPTRSRTHSKWMQFVIPASTVAVALLGIWLGSLTWKQESTNQNQETFIAYYENTIDDYSNSSLSSVYLEITTKANGGSGNE